MGPCFRRDDIKSKDIKSSTQPGTLREFQFTE
jgi:hypothetical protein